MCLDEVLWSPEGLSERHFLYTKKPGIIQGTLPQLMPQLMPQVIPHMPKEVAETPLTWTYALLPPNPNSVGGLLYRL